MILILQEARSKKVFSPPSIKTIEEYLPKTGKIPRAEVAYRWGRPGLAGGREGCWDPREAVHQDPNLGDLFKDPTASA